MTTPNPGWTYQMVTGCGKLYVTINEDAQGRPVGIFVNMGKAGGCSAAQSEAVARLLSAGLQSGISPEVLAKELQGISCHSPSGIGENRVLSCVDAVGIAISQYAEGKKSLFGPDGVEKAA